MLYLLLAIAIGIGATVYLIKKGKIKDADGDFIPDVVEDKVEETVQEVKLRAKRIKEEVADVVEEVREVVDQAKDITAAAKGKPRRGRKPGAKKSNGTGKRVEKKPTTSGGDASVLKNQK